MYQIQSLGWNGRYHTVARVESIYAARDWKYDHATEGTYRVMYYGECKLRFSVKGPGHW